MNKKLIAVILVIFVVIISGGIFFWASRKDGNKQEELQENATVSNEEITVANNVEPSSDNVSSDEVKEDEQKEEKNVVTEYFNERYAYSVKFPEGWYMNNDYSESVTKKEEVDDDVFLEMGGQTFWSNYKNMNDYSPSNRPSDFHILALTVYKDNSTSVEDFAKKLEFDEDSKKHEFQAQNVSGTEFVSAGLIAGNPRVAVIFKKNELFYVFNVAFIGGDTNAAATMEGIIATFNLR